MSSPPRLLMRITSVVSKPFTTTLAARPPTRTLPFIRVAVMRSSAAVPLTITVSTWASPWCRRSLRGR
jgi:hypothetical protein